MKLNSILEIYCDQYRNTSKENGSGSSCAVGGRTLLYTVLKSVKIKNLSRTSSVRPTSPPFLFSLQQRPSLINILQLLSSFFSSPQEHIPKHELHPQNTSLQPPYFLSFPIECGFPADTPTSHINFQYFRKNYFHEASYST